MRANVTVKVRLRPGILDPQGKAIEENLPVLGFDSISQVRVGKAIEMVIEGSDSAEIAETARLVGERFLANPVIEDFEIEVSESGQDSDLK